jgi:hypothetical protein
MGQGRHSLSFLSSSSFKLACHGVEDLLRTRRESCRVCMGYAKGTRSKIQRLAPPPSATKRARRRGCPPRGRHFGVSVAGCCRCIRVTSNAARGEISALPPAAPLTCPAASSACQLPTRRSCRRLQERPFGRQGTAGWSQSRSHALPSLTWPMRCSAVFSRGRLSSPSSVLMAAGPSTRRKYALWAAVEYPFPPPAAPGLSCSPAALGGPHSLRVRQPRLRRQRF